LRPRELVRTGNWKGEKDPAISLTKWSFDLPRDSCKKKKKKKKNPGGREEEEGAYLWKRNRFSEGKGIKKGSGKGKKKKKRDISQQQQKGGMS